MRLFLLLWYCALALAAQQQPCRTPSTPPQPVIRAGTEEVLLDVIVRDKKGRPIHELEAVYEDGTRQKVTAFRLGRRRSSGNGSFRGRARSERQDGAKAL